MRVIYVCHPYAGDPLGNIEGIRRLCHHSVRRGFVPLAPQLSLPQFLDEENERDLALKLCLRLVALADEVRVYGELTEGMRLEVEEARRLGIPVVDGEAGERASNDREPPR